MLRFKLLGQLPEDALALERALTLPLEEDNLAMNLHVLERLLLHRALRRSYGNRVETARRLGVSRRQLYLLIARHGRLVTEEYFNGWKADHLHTLQSVSKSFTSALVGIALERGEFRGLDEPVLDFFPDPEEFVAIDARKASLRLRDLLTMRTGVDYDEQGVFSPHATLNLLPWGRERWYLRRPMLDAPGATFRYDSGGVVLLSAMLKRRAGLHAEAYAERHLFAPLGIGGCCSILTSAFGSTRSFLTSCAAASSASWALSSATRPRSRRW